MAVTRINNNQISDASAGNAYVGINAAVKLQNYSVTATKIANNLVYGSDLTVAGNLTVQGNTTTIDTTYTTIEDPILLLASNQTGSPTVDIGFVGQRGTSENIAFVWDEGSGEFVTVYTTTGESNTTVSIASYANLHTGNANIGGNIVINGTTSLVGNIIGNVSFDGNVTVGNVLTNGQVSAAGNVTGGNINTGGIVTATGNISSSANITGGNLLTSGVVSGSSHIGSVVSVSANITGGNVLTGGVVSSTGNITSSANINGANLNATSGVSATTVVASGNVAGGNVVSSALVSGTTVSASANITGGNLLTSGIVSATGSITSAANITGGNLLTGGIISSTGNISSAGNISASYFLGNGSQLTGVNAATAGFPITAGTSNIAAETNGNIGVTVAGTSNVVTFASTGEYVTGVVSASGNITSAANVAGGNLLATNIVSAATVLGSVVSASANITGGNVLTSGIVSATGGITSAANVNGGNVIATTTVSAASLLGSVVSASANVTGGNLLTGGVVSSTGSITSAANINGANLNATSGVTATTVSASANITGGNVLTGGVVSSTGNITSAANVAGGNLVATSNVVGAGASISGNVSGGNLLTSGLVSSTGNITSAANISGGNLTITTKITTDTIETTGNVLVGGNLTVQGNIQYVNVDDLRVEDPIIVMGTGPNGAPLTTDDGMDRGIYMEYYTTGRGNAWMGWENSSGNLIAAADVTFTANNVVGVNNYGTFQTGNIYAQSALVDGNVQGGNLLTTGLISSTGNITSAANIAGGNLSLTGLISASGNINTNANINATSGQVKAATGYFTGNVDVLGNLNASVGIVYANSGIFYGDAVTGNNAGYFGVPGYTFLGSDIVIQTTGNVNNYSQINFQNINNGTRSSTDFVLTADNGNDSSNFFNMGITGGSWDGTQLNSLGNALGPNDGYLYADSGNVIIGTVVPNDHLRVIIGGSDNNYIVAEFHDPNTAATNTTTGTLTVKGGIGATGNIWGATLNATANVTGGNLLTGGAVSATANITGGNLITGGAVNATANVSGGNLITSGAISATGNISTAGNITGSYYFGNGSQLTGINATTSGFPITAGTSNINAVNGGNIFVTIGGTPNVVVWATDGEYVNGLISVTGNVRAGNIVVPGGNVDVVNFVNAGAVLATGRVEAGTTMSAAGNITGANIITGGLITATGNITSTANVAGGNVISTALVQGVTVSASGNVVGGNVTTGGQVSATGNVTSAANVAGGNVLATAVVSGASLLGSLASISGNITGANLNTGGTNGLTLNASTINSNAARITVNSNSSDVDFAVNGTGANVFYIDAGTNTASFGSSVQTTNAIVAFNATNSILMPVGNTAQRPATGVTGMLRFNTTLDAVEVYDTDSWTTVGTPSFTVITDEQFNGDGSTVVFTLSSATTTNSTIVSINGVVQIPTIAYSVTGAGNDELTFTEAPETGDIIDVRILTTTTEVTAISNSPGNAVVQTNATQAIVEITGDLNPVANVTYSLGNTTNRWKDLWLSGSSLHLGNIIMKNTSGNTVSFYGADGTTPATLDSTNVDTTTIANGTSNVSVASSGGNVRVNVGGTSNVAVFTTSGVTISGNITNGGSNATGNIGSSTGYFNTVFAKATSAQYADLAEIYAADADYEPGTVLSFGGDQEVTVSTAAGDARIAGVVSTNPSYVMNATLDAEFTATVALTGRVPTKVSGAVAKGDMMISGGNGRAVACATPTIGTVIGKALENHPGGDGVIEVVVGRL